MSASAGGVSAGPSRVWPMVRAGRSLAAAGLLACGAAAAMAQPTAPVEGLSQLTENGEGAVQQFVVILRAEPLAVVHARARDGGRALSEEEQRAYLAALRQSQSELLADLAALGARELGRTAISLNAVFVAASNGAAAHIATFPDVRTVQAIVNFQTHQAAPGDAKEVVPFVGADALRRAGLDGRGVKVAVLDSGVDYTHAAFGGPGTPAAFLSAYGSTPASPQNRGPVDWPRGRVVDGYDFVGESWPRGPLRPDPNPIAAPAASNDLGIVGTDGGHGTSVADIIAGGPYAGRPDNHGVAPAASLYAVKVCSAAGGSCSGVAILQGIDWALDPDGDGALTDAVDVINLSLGSHYGPKDNPTAEAAANAARAGVVVVCAAGNAGDHPYIVSSPATAAETIAVAQTSMPGARLFQIAVAVGGGESERRIAGTSLPWAPVRDVRRAELVRPVFPEGCQPLPHGSLSGRIALVERGTCNLSHKLAYAQMAGAVGVVIANDREGEAPTFSFGGWPKEAPAGFALTIPALVLRAAEAADLRVQLAAGQGVRVTFSPEYFIPLTSTVEAVSSRGPGLSDHRIKPEIAAPGASLAAVAGSGTELAPFGGTSGAAPVVAGTAALLRQLRPEISPLETKALLMNQAHPDTYDHPAGGSGQPSAISRSGAGEVRALASVTANAAAWVQERDQPSAPALSFGFHRVHARTTLSKTVRVRNYTDVPRRFSVAAVTRFAPGEPGAVTLRVPAAIDVPAGATADFEVTAVIDPVRLPRWNTDSGLHGGDGPRLGALECGGFVELREGETRLSLPWHLLPQRVHRAAVSPEYYRAGGTVPAVTNRDSTLPAEAEVFSLLGSSPRLPSNAYPSANDGTPLVDLQYVGARLTEATGAEGPVLEFAIALHGRHTHANYPAQFVVNLDVNNDGLADWSLFNQRASATDWRNVTYLQAATWDTAFPTGYTRTDFNSGTLVLRVPLSRLGLSQPPVASAAPVADPLLARQAFTFSVQAFDNYFTGALADEIGPLRYVAGLPRFEVEGARSSFTVPAGGRMPLPISIQRSAGATSETGLLILFAHARAGYEARAIQVAAP